MFFFNLSILWIVMWAFRSRRELLHAYKEAFNFACEMLPLCRLGLKEVGKAKCYGQYQLVSFVFL